MLTTIRGILVALALLLFGLAAIGVPVGRLNPVAGGLALWLIVVEVLGRIPEA